MRDSRFALLVTVPVALFLLGWSIYPIGYSFWLSLNDYAVKGGKIIPTFVGLQNYWLAVNDPDVQEALLHTLQFAGEAIPMVLLFSLGIALVLNEAIPGGGFVKVIALLPWAVSDFATGIVWKWIWVDGFGFVNGVLINLHLVKGSTTLITGTSAMHQLALAEAWHIAPLGAFFLLAALQVIPEDLYRQSRVDGAGTWGRFRFVTFPFINYSMLITLVIATLFTMESLDEVLLLTGGGPGSVTQTLTYRIYQYSFVQFNLGYGAAVSYFLLIFIFILATAWFRLLQRRR